MGFRLEIRADNEKRYFDEKKDFYGTKFYGYDEEWRTSISAYFFSKLFGEIILEEIDFSYCTDDYEISADDFKLFVALYEYDFSKRFNVSDVLRRWSVVRAMLDSDTPKILSWN